MEWILCPECRGKTRTQIREDTVLENFPLFRFADWRGERFYVRRCADAAMEARACAELRAMLRDAPERENFEKTEEEP